MRRSNWGFVFVTGTLTFVACGGSTTPAEEPRAPARSPQAAGGAVAEGKAPPKPKSAASDAASQPSTGDADATPPPESKSVRSAKDILTRDGVYFELSFADSDAHEAAEKRCSEKAKDDPKTKAKCMTKESERIDANGVAFRQDESGNWFWLTIRRTGSKMVPLHKFEVDFADDADHSVSLVPKGRDHGTKPGRTPGKVVVQVPSDSELILSDPKFGKMVYHAKLGLFGKDER